MYEGNIVRGKLIYRESKKLVYETDYENLVEIESVSNENLMVRELFRIFTEKGIPNSYVMPGTTEGARIAKKTEPILLMITAYVSSEGILTELKDQEGEHQVPKDEIVAKSILSQREIGYVEYVTERATYITNVFFENNDVVASLQFGKLPDGQILLNDFSLEIRDRLSGEIIRTVFS